MPQLDKETTTNMTPVEEIRNVQLNEKISETTYQILHPETSANQVITNSLNENLSNLVEETVNSTFGEDYGFEINLGQVEATGGCNAELRCCCTAIFRLSFRLPGQCVFER